MISNLFDSKNFFNGHKNVQLGSEAVYVIYWLPRIRIHNSGFCGSRSNRNICGSTTRLFCLFSVQHLRHVERVHLKMRTNYLRICFDCVQYPAPAACGASAPELFCLFSIQHLRHVERVHLNYFVCVQYPAPAARGAGAPEDAEELVRGVRAGILREEGPGEAHRVRTPPHQDPLSHSGLQQGQEQSFSLKLTLVSIWYLRRYLVPTHEDPLSHSGLQQGQE